MPGSSITGFLSSMLTISGMTIFGHQTSALYWAVGIRSALHASSPQQFWKSVTVYPFYTGTNGGPSSLCNLPISKVLVTWDGRWVCSSCNSPGEHSMLLLHQPCWFSVAQPPTSWKVASLSLSFLICNMVALNCRTYELSPQFQNLKICKLYYKENS